MTEQAQEFNYFDFFKFHVLKAYYSKLFKGETTDEITIEIKSFDNNKSYYFYKTGAMKFIKYETIYTEEGKQLTRVYIKDLNLNAKAISKTGKEYKVFNSFDIAKAVKAAQKIAA